MTQTPSTPQRIVVGVDSSDNALHAAIWAARLAVDLGVPLLLVHALDLGATSVYSTAVGYTEDRREHGAALLGQVARTLREKVRGVIVDTELFDQGAPQTLVALSDESTLVVSGTRGHGGFAGLLLGSVSLKLAGHSHGPIAVVRADEPSEPENAIVLGVEPEEHEAPIRFAFALAAQLGATLNVVRAWWPQAAYGGYYSADIGMAERDHAVDVEGLIKALREEYPGVKVFVSPMRGNPVPMLLEASRGARLLVVGAHRKHSPLSVGAGYVVQGLLSHATTPVAVVPVV
ncbi:MAG TPA: universal stress protein [Actinocrinis sp.]|uniref:universal stress protein n=1 Tax=Actinocrinis sp. TaxID=1920516 RepID=UPI002D48D297|nr:universal stress protein [Actinocrinis sp.]HZU56623.1 universal stress protein [Actinocrinis sp.]